MSEVLNNRTEYHGVLLPDDIRNPDIDHVVIGVENIPRGTITPIDDLFLTLNDKRLSIIRSLPDHPNIKSMADSLWIGHKTSKNHLLEIYRTLGVSQKTGGNTSPRRATHMLSLLAGVRIIPDRAEHFLADTTRLSGSTLKCIGLAACGYKNWAIAEISGYTEKTVKNLIRIANRETGNPGRILSTVESQIVIGSIEKSCRNETVHQV